MYVNEPILLNAVDIRYRTYPSGTAVEHQCCIRKPASIQSQSKHTNHYRFSEDTVQSVKVPSKMSPALDAVDKV